MGMAQRMGWIGSGLLTVFALAATAQADPFEYHITGEFSDTGDNPALEDSSFINRYTSGGSNGALDISPAGTFDITRTEGFFNYSDIQSFGYFGLLSNYDESNIRTDIRFFVAAKPGTIVGDDFSTVFADYLSANPAVTNLTDFLQVMDDGPDFPTQGANQDWIDFNDFVAANASGAFAGNILTTFQAGETLDLIVFDNTSELGSDFGNIAVEAVEVPEPGALALLGLGGLLAMRRRQK